MIVFYAPVKEGGEIKGLFLGLFFAQDYLRSMLTTEYFNVRVPMLLSSKDETIVASSSSNVSGDPLYPYLLDQKSMSTSDSRQVIDAVNDQKETIFVNEKEGPIENVSVLPVPGYDFMLVQGFSR